jgi:formate dehydrogenase beta subunit
MFIGKKPDKQAPCQNRCPAGIDIPRYIRYALQGRYADALKVIREKIPFPSICGHVCLGPCQVACHEHHATQPVAINAIKRFISEKAAAIPPPRVSKSTGKRVAIIGSGPAGLTAAFYLTILGHAVVVFEALPKAGGMMRVGIPKYRLPDDVLEQEIENVCSIGFEIRTGTKVDSAERLLEDGFEAVLVAVGAHSDARLKIPGSDLEGVLVGSEFLKTVKLGHAVRIGKTAAIIGGGNVAFDCARVALRLGWEEVHIFCLECGDDMRATPEEVQAGTEEGIILHPSHTICRILGEQGHVAGVEVCEIESFCFGEQGEVQIQAKPELMRTLAADTFIFAVGQRPDLGLINGMRNAAGAPSGRLEVDPETLATAKPGLFVAGDAATGTVSVIAAIAAGRRAAASIDRFLGGTGKIEEIPASAEMQPPAYPRGRPVGLRTTMPSLSPDKRTRSFEEVDLGFDEKMTLREANRCLWCDSPIRVNPELCVGCNRCALTCSIRFCGGSNPRFAKIKVIPPDRSKTVGEPEIIFSAECDACGSCVRACTYGCLTRRPAERGEK